MHPIEVDTNGIVWAASRFEAAAQGIVQGGYSRQISDIAGAMPGSKTAPEVYNVYRNTDIAAHYLAQACQLFAQSLRAAAANYDKAENANIVAGK